MACAGNVDPSRASDRPKPSVVLVVHESLSGVLMDTSRGRGQIPTLSVPMWMHMPEAVLLSEERLLLKGRTDELVSGWTWSRHLGT